jgi:hypothetical protein
MTRARESCFDDHDDVMMWDEMSPYPSGMRMALRGCAVDVTLPGMA